MSAFDPPFVVDGPEIATVPFVFNVPHAGSIYPDAFVQASALEASALRRSEDAFVDELFAPAPMHGWRVRYLPVSATQPRQVS